MTSTIKISVPAVQSRTWSSVEQIRAVFSDDELVQIVHRYCDAQDHARNYRLKAASRTKAILAKARELGIEA